MDALDTANLALDLINDYRNVAGVLARVVEAVENGQSVDHAIPPELRSAVRERLAEMFDEQDQARTLITRFLHGAVLAQFQPTIYH